LSINLVGVILNHVVITNDGFNKEESTMIEWQDSYSTGIVRLDEQHKTLFLFCNDLEENLKNKTVTKDLLDIELRFLERYAIGHFGQEETCMHKYACPIAKTNKQAHEEFIKKYKDFQKRIISDDAAEEILKELHHFLENWLKNHICKIDSQLKSCVH
jgi:hemerythrin